ncbi:hypothetical protein IUY40_18825 [Flavobacterium sp. ALJ2]|nr:hypothetical protein [Flavobacterium sp. ALJ2]MBF7093589.1 hypothetical protein [Flavobacterium sp. ALJ2]
MDSSIIITNKIRDYFIKQASKNKIPVQEVTINRLLKKDEILKKLINV